MNCARAGSREAPTIQPEIWRNIFFAEHSEAQAGNSQANVDTVAPDGTRYQIKRRRITRFNNSRQMSAIREMAESRFDFLAG